MTVHPYGQAQSDVWKPSVDMLYSCILKCNVNGWWFSKMKSGSLHVTRIPAHCYPVTDSSNTFLSSYFNHSFISSTHDNNSTGLGIIPDLPCRWIGLWLLHVQNLSTTGKANECWTFRCRHLYCFGAACQCPGRCLLQSWYAFSHIYLCRSSNLATVHLKIDMVRYNESLEKYESGRSEKREQTLLDKFPPAEQVVLRTPSVIIDSGGRIIVWYLPGAMTGMIMVCLISTFISYFISSGCIWQYSQTDMQCATNSIGNLLNDSITTRKATEWRTHESNFYPSPDGKITPSCINISPAWFQQGREVCPVRINWCCQSKVL